MNARALRRFNRPLAVLELFGPPGAGKTTITQSVAERVGVTTRKDLSADWARKSAIEQLAFVRRAFGRRRTLLAAMRFGRDAGITTPESIFRMVRLLAKTEWLSSQSSAVLLDQGFLQDLWSILISAKSRRCDPTLLASLIRALYEGMDVKIAVIDVDVDTASARIRDRAHGGSRLDGLPEEERHSSLASADLVQQEIMDAARLAGLQVQVLDGSAPPGKLADQLMSLLTDVDQQDDSRSGPRPRRISVVGSTGSGKTYFSRELATHLGLPVYSLDDVRAAANQPLAGHKFQDVVEELIKENNWIIDGHYRDVRHQIWRRADLVIWLNYPLPVIASRLMSRFRSKQRRPDRRSNIPAGPAPERPSWGMRFKRIARTLRERGEYGRILRSAKYQNLCVVELTSTQMARQWLGNL